MVTDKNNRFGSAGYIFHPGYMEPAAGLFNKAKYIKRRISPGFIIVKTTHGLFPRSDNNIAVFERKV
jgi:hypothetical protein